MENAIIEIRRNGVTIYRKKENPKLKPITSFTGKPVFQKTAKPSHQAILRRIGVHDGHYDGLTWLLRGYVCSIRGQQLFPAKGQL